MREPSCLAAALSWKAGFPRHSSPASCSWNALIPSASMTAPRRNCKLKTDRGWPVGVGANLWSWVLFGDRSWSVTCSRCCWWNWQGLGPDPQTTAACKQERQSWHSCTSRSNSWQMSRATSVLRISTVYAYITSLSRQGSVNIVISFRNVTISHSFHNHNLAILRVALHHNFHQWDEPWGGSKCWSAVKWFKIVGKTTKYRNMPWWKVMMQFNTEANLNWKNYGQLFPVLLLFFCTT